MVSEGLYKGRYMSPLCYKIYVPLDILEICPNNMAIIKISVGKMAIFFFLEDWICCDNVTHCTFFGRPPLSHFVSLLQTNFPQWFLLSEPMPHFDTNVSQWETLAPLYTSSTCKTRSPCILPCRASGKYTMPREGRFHVYQGIYTSSGLINIPIYIHVGHLSNQNRLPICTLCSLVRVLHTVLSEYDNLIVCCHIRARFTNASFYPLLSWLL